MPDENRRGCLIVVSGPSGAGKGTLLKMAMEQDPNAVFSVSATTRGIRPGEVDGRDYYFIDNERFDSMIANGEFLEYADVFGLSKYGTPKAPVVKSMDDGKDVYLDIDVQGAFQVKKSMPEAIMLFIMAPSMDILESRLRQRGTESQQAVLKRLETAKLEIASAKDYDYIIINDDAQQAADVIKYIVNAERCRPTRMQTYMQNWR